jgi:hypothetical protein
MRVEHARQHLRFERTTASRRFISVTHVRDLSPDWTLDAEALVSDRAETQFARTPAFRFFSARVRGRVGRPILLAGGSYSRGEQLPLSSVVELVRAGFSFDDLTAGHTVPASRSRERVDDAHLGVRLPFAVSPGGSVDVRVGARLRSYRGRTLPDVALAQIRDLVRFSSTTSFESGRSGRVAEATAGVDWSLRERSAAPSAVGASLDAVYTHPMDGGDILFHESMSGLPRWRTRLDVRIDVDDRLGGKASVLVQGPREWPQFRDTEFPDRPAQTRVDAALWKRLAGDAALLTLNVRNALDTPWRLHPAGIDEQMSIRVGLVVRIAAGGREE